jgi:hypothetical protein
MKSLPNYLLIHPNPHSNHYSSVILFHQSLT